MNLHQMQKDLKKPCEEWTVAILPSTLGNGLININSAKLTIVDQELTLKEHWIISSLTLSQQQISKISPSKILYMIIPLPFILKCFKIRYIKHSDTGFLYVFCSRRHASSIIDALTRCGFGDKLDR